MGQAALGQLGARLARCVRSPGCVIAHVGVDVVAGTILVLLNAISSPGELWFWRPLLVLGALLTLHIVLIVGSGHTSRLRVAADAIGSGWSRWLASRPSQEVEAARSPHPEGARHPALRQQITPWLSSLRPQADQRPSPRSSVTVEAEPVTWPATAPYGTWPAARPDPAAPATTTWPASSPAWSASWPALPAPALPSLPAARQVRSTGHDRVLDGAHGVDPANPHWDQLEVAAASWLAQRAADPVAETAP